MTDKLVVVDGKTFEVFDGEIRSAYGRKLLENKWEEGKTPVEVITYETRYEKVTSFDKIPADEMPNNDSIVDIVNNKRKANARQKAMQTAQDNAGVIKPTMEDDDELKIKSIVIGLVASKHYDESQARALARKMLNLPAE